MTHNVLSQIQCILSQAETALYEQMQLHLIAETATDEQAPVYSRSMCHAFSRNFSKATEASTVVSDILRLCEEAEIEAKNRLALNTVPQVSPAPHVQIRSSAPIPIVA